MNDAARSLRCRLAGHLRTLGPPLLQCVLPARRLGRPWSTNVADAALGTVRLTGELVASSTPRLCILVHGLGGSPASIYVRRTAAALAAAGTSCLCLALRGADRLGEDFYNVAQAADLHVVCADPALAAYGEIHVVGFSMGGHTAMHFARTAADPRVRTCTAVCTPVDLQAAQRHIDDPRRRFYCRWVLAGLKEIYAAVAARRPVPTPVAEVMAVRTILEWDELAISKRYGFRSAAHFYEASSVAPHLGSLAVPTLLVLADGDPLVPPSVVVPWLPGTAANLHVRCAPRSGHLAFRRDLDLGFGPRHGLAAQLQGFWAACR
jgi:predicted alpha/beta-fold hydrolase